MASASEIFSRSAEGVIANRIRNRQISDMQAEKEILRQENEAQRAQLEELQRPREEPTEEEGNTTIQSRSFNSSEPVLVAGRGESDQGDYVVTIQNEGDKRGIIRREVIRFDTYQEADDFINKSPYRRVRIFNPSIYRVGEGEKFGEQGEIIYKTPQERAIEKYNRRLNDQNRYARQAAIKVSEGKQISSVERAAYERLSGGQKLPDNSNLAPYGFKKEGFAVREISILAPPDNTKELYATRTNLKTGVTESTRPKSLGENTYKSILTSDKALNSPEGFSGRNDAFRTGGISGQDNSIQSSSLRGLASEEVVRQAEDRQRLEEEGSKLRGVAEPFVALGRSLVKFSRATSPVLDYGFKTVGKDQVLKPITPIYRDSDIQNLGLAAGVGTALFFAPEIAIVSSPYLLASGTKRALENPTRFTVGEAVGNTVLGLLPFLASKKVSATSEPQSPKVIFRDELVFKDIIPKQLTDSIKTVRLQTKLDTQSILRDTSLLRKQITYNTFRPVAVAIDPLVQKFTPSLQTRLDTRYAVRQAGLFVRVPVQGALQLGETFKPPREFNDFIRNEQLKFNLASQSATRQRDLLSRSIKYQLFNGPSLFRPPRRVTDFISTARLQGKLDTQYGIRQGQLLGKSILYKYQTPIINTDKITKPVVDFLKTKKLEIELDSQYTNRQIGLIARVPLQGAYELGQTFNLPKGAFDPLKSAALKGRLERQYQMRQGSLLGRVPAQGAYDLIQGLKPPKQVNDFFASQRLKFNLARDSAGRQRDLLGKQIAYGPLSPLTRRESVRVIPGRKGTQEVIFQEGAKIEAFDTDQGRILRIPATSFKAKGGIEGIGEGQAVLKGDELLFSRFFYKTNDEAQTLIGTKARLITDGDNTLSVGVSEVERLLRGTKERRKSIEVSRSNEFVSGDFPKSIFSASDIRKADDGNLEINLVRGGIVSRESVIPSESLGVNVETFLALEKGLDPKTIQNYFGTTRTKLREDIFFNDAPTPKSSRPVDVFGVTKQKTKAEAVVAEQFYRGARESVSVTKTAPLRSPRNISRVSLMSRTAKIISNTRLPATRTTPTLNLIQSSKQIPKQDNLLRSSIINIQDTGSLLGLKNIQSQGFETLLGKVQSQRQQSALRSVQRQNQTQLQSRINRTRQTQRLNRASMLFPDEMEPANRNKRQSERSDNPSQAYAVYIKNKLQKIKKGKYKGRGYTKVGDDLDRDSAEGLLFSTLDKYANRSGYVKPVSGIGKRRADLASAKTALINKFRANKKNSNIFTEKSAFAIDSSEEVNQIPYEAIRQKKGKKSKTILSRGFL